MRSILLVFIAIGVFAKGSKAQSQGVEFTPFAGYTFADKFNFDQGSGRIGDGLTYGGTLSLIADKVNALELTYSRMGAEASAYSESQQIEVLTPIGINYILLGGTRLFPLQIPLELFVGVDFGVAIMGSKENEFNTMTKVAVGFNGGMKYFFTKNIGFRFQPSLNFPLTKIGGEAWWNPATGGENEVSSTLLMQFGFTGGLIFKLK